MRSNIAERTASGMTRGWLLSIFMVVLLATSAYWKVLSAGFVWDDFYFLFREGAWMLEGSEWLSRSLAEFYVFQGDAASISTNYFRPLVLLGYVAQMRLSGGDPSLLHGVSLAIHIINALLVMALTSSWGNNRLSPRLLRWLTCGAGVAYVLHPALVEAAAWISGQFDLLVTTFALSALIADRTIERATPRALAVALFFFLAALCKEAAVVIPLLLAAAHWHATPPGQGLHALLNRHWRTYTLLIVAGLLYLALRWHSLGHLLQSNGLGLPWIVRIQMFGHAFLEYWHLALVPFYDLSPLHEVSPDYFLELSTAKVAKTAAGIVIFLLSAALLLTRKPAGFPTASFAVALLPVLHLLPMLIGQNLYAERFLTLPLAVLFASSAVFIGGWLASDPGHRTSRALFTIILSLVWILGAFVTTKSQVPLWSSNHALWSWAHAKHPESTFAINQLLNELVHGGDQDQIETLVETLESNEEIDAAHAITLSTYYINKKEYGKAIHLINGVHEISSPGSRLQTAALINFAALSASMGDHDAAESALRDALLASPDNADAHIYLVRILLAAGKMDDAAKELPLAAAKLSPLTRESVHAQLVAQIEAAGMNKGNGNQADDDQER